MTHSLKEQIQAIQKAREIITKVAGMVDLENPELDSKLNDAGSTIAALSLNSGMTDNDKTFQSGKLSGLLKALKILQSETKNAGSNHLEWIDAIGNVGNRIHALIKELK